MTRKADLATAVAAKALEIGPAEMGELLLTEDEAAMKMKLSTTTLRKWRRTNFGPPYTQWGARIVRYSPSAIEEWVRGQLIRPAGGEAGAG